MDFKTKLDEVIQRSKILAQNVNQLEEKRQSLLAEMLRNEGEIRLLNQLIEAEDGREQREQAEKGND